VILTLDLGSSVTKVALWDPYAGGGAGGPGGLVSWAGAPVATEHPRPGWSEQDPADWWASLVQACGEVRSAHPEAFAAVRVVGCTGARQTMAVVDAEARPVGPAILWSDRRAGIEALRMADSAGMAVHGIPLDGASVAAKLVWLYDHEPDRMAVASWVLTPRDLVVRWLTGVVATDPTMASRSGLALPDGRVVRALAGEAEALLAPVHPPDRVTGELTESAAGALGLAPGTSVVIGVGDRASEVLGSGATDACPLVSWGTTANLSVPVEALPARVPDGLVVSRSATGGWLLEGGLSAAGSLLAWIGALTGQPPATLIEGAGRSGPGARGVVATPWLDGARAPWGRGDATLGFAGLDSSHGPGDLARAAIEGVAWDVQRCLEAAAGRQPSGPPPTGLALGGSGATSRVWVDVLAGITGMPASTRRSGQAASAGAALLAARAVGTECDLDRLDPVDPGGGVPRPDPATVAAYRELRARSDRVVAAALRLGLGVAADAGTGDDGLVAGGASCG
jgi:xylulokinase